MSVIYDNIKKNKENNRSMKNQIPFEKFSLFEYQLNFKMHDMDRLFLKFSLRNIISCTYIKSNQMKDDIHSRKVIIHRTLQCT